jgi:hypothetical protein
MALFGVNVASLGGATSKESFYELLDKVHGGNTATTAADAPPDALLVPAVTTTTTGKKGRVGASSLYPSSRIAQVFAAELKQLRDDPEFSGTTSQISYLKDIVAADDQH